MRKHLYFSLAALCVPIAASAQVTTPRALTTIRQEARVHAGPLLATPTVRLTNFGVDTNVFNAAGDQKSDFTLTVTPMADLWLPVARRALFSATVASDLVYYAKYATERSVNPRVSTRAELYLRRLTLFGQNAYLNTRERPNFEIDLRSRHVENDATAGASLRLTNRLSVEGAVVRGITRYQTDAVFDGTSLQQTLNRDTTGFQVMARHQLTPLTTLAVRYENLADRFPYAAARDADSIRVMPGVEFKARALIRGSAYVGYRQFTPRTSGQLPQFSGLVSQLGLSYTLLGSTTFGVSYRRDLTYSYEPLQPFFVDDSAGVSVRRALSRRFDLLFSADRHRYSYRDLLVQSGVTPGAPRIDTTWNYAGSFGYRVGRDGRVGVGLSYYERDSTAVRTSAYTGLRAGTVISYGF